MAVDRLPDLTTRLPQPQPTREVRSAQAAFFQAALARVDPAAAPSAPSVSNVAPARASAPAPPAEPPQKSSYRPGSLLDIRI